ncbi:hypothetical protein ACE6H2_011212 [Prunus campanulata]
MEGNNLDVRKGAWTKEEDGLLRQCIENHGEGKWHQVPYKAVGRTKSYKRKKTNYKHTQMHSSANQSVKYTQFAATTYPTTIVTTTPLLSPSHGQH